jgi:hypothetical protein
MGANANKKIGIAATPTAAANITTFSAVMSVELIGPADKRSVPATSRMLIATASPMIKARTLLREGEWFEYGMLGVVWD